MSINTSVGRGPAHGGNENHDGDPLNTTFGETVKQEPPAGNDLFEEMVEEIVEKNKQQSSTATVAEPSKRKG